MNPVMLIKVNDESWKEIVENVVFGMYLDQIEDKVFDKLLVKNLVKCGLKKSDVKKWLKDESESNLG